MDKSFLPENFLLSNSTSEKLYFEFAEPQPIFDYHCHIPPVDIAGDRRFKNLTQIWLVEGRYGDHYKWRAMRANGVPERFITGDASDYDKFLAFARTVRATLRNPLYHWTHLELRRYFGIKELLNEESAPRVWAQANEQLQELTVHRDPSRNSESRSFVRRMIRLTTWRITRRFEPAACRLVFIRRSVRTRYSRSIKATLSRAGLNVWRRQAATALQS